jgi:hypothetical protein
MIVLLAHIMGVPVEETLVPLASGAGAGTVLWLTALIARRIHAIGAGGGSVEPLE